MGVVGVVEAFRGIDEGESTVDEEAEEMGGAAFDAERLDSVHGGKNFVVHRDFLQLVAGHREGDFAAERGIPLFLGTTGAGQHEATIFEVATEVGFLGIAELEVVHHRVGDFLNA